MDEVTMKKDATSTALAVKELEPGEFHWLLLEENLSVSKELPAYTPKKVSHSYPNASAAWVAGYLVIRASLRRKSV
jgi:hypothetical protein